MEELLQEIVALLIKHGIHVELDSAMIETGPGGEFVFKCNDLNREDWERRFCIEMIDRIRGI